MMKFNHPEFKDVSFSLPDEWTVRQVLKYDAVIDFARSEDEKDGLYEKLWNALLAVLDLDEWNCDVDPGISLDEVSNEKTLAVIKFAALAGWSARRAQDLKEEEEKN